jgi:hypothetical protein
MVDATEENWLSLDEAKDVTASLRHLRHCLKLTETDPTAWKWCIIAIHNALQGAMTCHLSGTANLGCLSKKSACEWFEWHDKRRRGEINMVETPIDEWGIVSYRPVSQADQPPRHYMATPQVLFDRLHKEKLRVDGGCGAVLSITLEQRKSFKLLNGLRNKFSHFTPMGWSIELSGLPRVFNDILIVVRMISDDPWPFRHLSESDRMVYNRLLDNLSQDISSRPMI